ncbi:putative ADP-ribosylation factor-binding protein C1F3.05 [Schizosaccharomyces pombe]
MRSSQTLSKYIDKATDQFNLEPNLALNIEIADLINEKKGNAPREAALLILKRVNSANPTVSYLALHLLDICVKNCGYPFHFQIASEEFLNGFVSRFPNHPISRMNKIQTKMLEMLEEWNYMLCKNNRHREDFSRIHDIRELMAFRGYKFPAVDEDSIAVMKPNNSLRSAQELAREDLEAHKAKLQELLRRGTPMDLAEANALMKVIAGYDEENTEDYSALAAADLESIRSKALRVKQFLVNQTVSLEEGTLADAVESLKVYQTKIARILREENEDEYYVQKLLSLNDLLINVIEECSNSDLIHSDTNVVSSQPNVVESHVPPSSNDTKQESSLIDLMKLTEEPAVPSPSLPTNVPANQSLSMLSSLSNSMSSTSNGALNSPSYSHAAIPNTNSSLTSILQSDSLMISTQLTSVQKSSGFASYSVQFSNCSLTWPVSEVVFQVAVVKSLKLQLLPHTGDAIIAPGKQNAAHEIMNITNIPADASDLRIRWRVQWIVGTDHRVEQGESHLPL